MIFRASLILCFLFVSSYSIAQNSNGDTYYLYLIGDAGEPTVSNVVYKKTIQKLQASNPSVPSAVVFLGDNVYPRGLEEEEDRHRINGEEILTSQIQLAENIDQLFFIPGNHDWKRGRQDGLQQLLHQQVWIDSLKKKNIRFLPEGGCPGPEEIELNENLVLVIIDSQWWLHPWEKPEGENGGCDNKVPQDVVGSIEDILQRNAGKQVVVAAHHPVYTYGEHGGVFTLNDHLFPLTNAAKFLYLPLPVIGSIYPLYRMVFGNIQDIAHPAYREFRTQMHELLKKYPGVIYAAGHEHALQHIVADSIKYIVSGAGSKSSFVKKKEHAQFVKAEIGFSRIVVSNENKVRIEYYSGNREQPDYVSAIKIPPSVAVPEETGATERLVKVAASARYEASKKKKKWLGENYREEWATKIEVPVFDFQAQGEPLKIIQRGGGQQTLSLRLEDPAGRQYTLRSIEKYPEKAVPEMFRKTFAKDLVQDQISASHPYGALVVPALAEAAGIYHTNPTVVWLTNDSRLGIYRKDFANRLMLFEERPEGDANGMDFFGNADDIVSTFKVVDKLADDNDNRVDEHFVLKSRLFDLLIGDWDRHDDQWRWAEFDKKKGKLYRPIPRDRDQTFFVNEGKIPKVFSKRWALPKLQGFDYELEWTPGFMFNGRYFDRSFLSGLSREDWNKEAETLKAQMSDQVIEQAIHQWPEEIFSLHGQEIIDKLKSRRDRLTTYALDHYLFLAREVNVVGSDKHELFTTTYLEDGQVRIRVQKIKKDGEVDKDLYDRTFLEEETNEIRLYGLHGDDRFVFEGEEKTKIKIRTIGGKGDDVLKSEAREKPLVYDKPKGIEIAEGSNFRDHRSRDLNVNTYNRKEYKYNLLAPLIFGNYNVDDGLFIGGGFLANTHGFRKDPFKARHLFLGSYAINTSSFNFIYSGRFTHLVGKWNGEIDVNAKSPNFVNNFFGLGNETVFNKDIEDDPAFDVENSIDYYRLRFKEWSLDFRLSRKIGSYGFVRIGPSLQFVELERSDEDRFVKDYETTLAEPILEVYKSFTGINYGWGVDMRNNPLVTTRGLYFEQYSRWMNEFNSNSISTGTFGYHTATLALYQTFKFPARLTFAARVTGGITRGDYEIYQAQILDGKTELRGFRKTRFYGDSKLVFNNEIRFKLGEIRSYVLPASVGLLGFYDIGRVWYKDENGLDPSTISGDSGQWHKGFGGGVWFTPFNVALVSTEVGHSVEGTLVYLRLGFLF